MKNDLMDYVMVDNIFTSEECQTYMNKLNQTHWQPHRWYQNESDQFHNIKDFEVTYHTEIQNMMRDPVMKFLTKYFITHRSGGDPECEFSGVRFNRYEVGESINHHVDHIHSLFDGKKRGIPVISFVGVFNDDYEGGEFMLCNEEIKLKQGDCIIFPSVFLYPHEVKPVTKGTRYSWVLWSW
jgi:predicted 2-oxoglutarate/Fe(II)-dependent dioxygenase YbiX